MSRLADGDGDGRLHHEDGSHRWVAPRGRDQGAWEAEVRAHVEAHRAAPVAGRARRSPRDAAQPSVRPQRVTGS